MLMLPQFSTPTRKLKSRLAAFRKNEDGSLIIFTLYLFIMMLIIGGLAVDFMRYEVTRSRIANTLDRAILAAADLDQSMDPNLVVQNYFSINGMDQFLNAPTNVQSGLNYRTVNANASATVPMIVSPCRIGDTALKSELPSAALPSITRVKAGSPFSIKRRILSSRTSSGSCEK